MKIFNIQNIEKKKAYWCRPPYKRCRCSIVCASKHSSSAQPNKTQLIPPNNLPHNPTLHHPSTQKKNTSNQKRADRQAICSSLFLPLPMGSSLFSLQLLLSASLNQEHLQLNPQPTSSHPRLSFFQTQLFMLQEREGKIKLCVCLWNRAHSLTPTQTPRRRSRSRNPRKMLFGFARVLDQTLNVCGSVWMKVSLCHCRRRRRARRREVREQRAPPSTILAKKEPLARVWASERDEDARRERLPQHTAPDFWIWDRISEQIQRNGEIEQIVMVKKLNFVFFFQFAQKVTTLIRIEKKNWNSLSHVKSTVLKYNFFYWFPYSSKR